MTFRLTRGETFSLALEELDGTDLDGATCRADLKAARNGGAPGDQASDTTGLAVGNYVVDARIELTSGFVEVADLQRVQVVERVTI